MKQYISKVLKSVAVFFLGFPFVYIVLAATLFDIPFGKCVGILLSPFYYVVTICAVVVGYGLWEMHRWSWHLFLIAQVLIGYENAILVYGYAETHHKIFAFTISLLFQIILTFRVAREIRVPYFFPRTRWWESNPRYRFSVPVGVTRSAGEVCEGEILDLSTTGCFIKLRSDVVADETLLLKFTVFGYELQCEGKNVWSAQSSVTHPKGIGVKFNLLSKGQKRSLRMICRRLKKIATFYRRSRYLVNQEEFLRQLREIESGTGEKTKKT